MDTDGIIGRMGTQLGLRDLVAHHCDNFNQVSTLPPRMLPLPVSLVNREEKIRAYWMTEGTSHPPPSTTSTTDMQHSPRRLFHRRCGLEPPPQHPLAHRASPLQRNHVVVPLGRPLRPLLRRLGAKQRVHALRDARHQRAVPRARLSAAVVRHAVCDGARALADRVQGRGRTAAGLAGQVWRCEDEAREGEWRRV